MRIAILFTLSWFTAEPANSATSKLELKDGDRIVLVGDTLIERDQAYGYLETEILRRQPALKLTFRNLGWSADTPAGRSRCYFDPPEVGFTRLVEQIKACQPTILIVGYGMAHALEIGDVDAFTAEMNRLLDAVVTPEMRVVLLSPIKPVGAPRRAMSKAEREDIDEYLKAVEQLAALRKATFVKLVIPQFGYADDGISLNETGYAHFTSQVVEMVNDRESPSISERIDLDQIKIGNETASDILKARSEVRFNLSIERLPSLVNSADYFWPGAIPLGEGSYRGSVGGFGWTRSVGVPVKWWETVQNIPIRKIPIPDDESITYGRWGGFIKRASFPWSDQLEELRQLVIEKNALYFQRYRPQNITYLLGFRAYEQGQNAKEIEQLDPMIASLEKRIDELRKPKPLPCMIRKID